jgi:hypothetical protein
MSLAAGLPFVMAAQRFLNLLESSCKGPASGLASNSPLTAGYRIEGISFITS